MYGKIIILIAAVFMLHEVEPLDIPHYFKQCARSDPNFNQCAKRSAQETLKTLVKGDRKYRIPNLDPLNIPFLNINQAGNLKIKLINAKIHGLPNTIIENCDFDFKNNRISISNSLHVMKIESEYEMNGKILVLPINGKGPSSLIFQDLKFDYNFNFDIVNRNGVKYLQPRKGKITYEAAGMKLHFENLFNGDKLLGEETNNFLNENWVEVNKELGPGVVEALAEVVHLVLTNVCELVPFDKLFPERI